jgi:protein-tyrosine phosphatase
MSKEQPNKRVLFVCLGNICRSVAAQTVLEKMASDQGVNIEVDSAGTYGGHAGQQADPRMRVHATRRGYNITHRARRVRENDFEYFDLIIAMDNSNYYDLMELAPTVEDQAKVAKMIDYCRHHSRYDYVPDPYYEGSEGFEIVLDLLEDGCSNLLEQLR